MNSSVLEPSVVFIGFLVVVLASRNIGSGFRSVGLPQISGFILTGLLVGPYALGFIDKNSLEYLGLIDAFALPFIAFAAGSELQIRFLRHRLRSILTILTMIVLVVLSLGTVAFVMLSDRIHFTAGMTFGEVFGVAILGGTILIAVSPAGVIAVIKELRAKGPFTQTALGVTVLMDSVAIVLFAINASIANVLLEGTPFNVGLALFVLLEIAFDVITGLIVGLILRALLSFNLNENLKSTLVILLGFVVFSLSRILGGIDIPLFPVPIFSEPLLICVAAGFYVANYSHSSIEFREIIENLSPTIFVLFFTTIGIGLKIDVLLSSWLVCLVLLLVRLSGMFAGCWIGGTIVGNPAIKNRILGMSFITQAGISLSLAKAVSVEFPGWGDQFATLFIGVIVANTIVGPLFFKKALYIIGEAHPRAEGPVGGESRSAIIFGIEGQSKMLARQLVKEEWNVKLVSAPGDEKQTKVQIDYVDVCSVDELTPDSLRNIGMNTAAAVVCMLDDDANYKICEIAYEHFGTDNLVVRLHDGNDAKRFNELGALIVEPTTAMVNLIDSCVRSPSTVSLLLNHGRGNDVVEIKMTNPSLHEIAVRDLKLPSDVLVMTVRRKTQQFPSHGYTRIRLGDRITILGAEESLEEVRLLFDV